MTIDGPTPNLPPGQVDEAIAHYQKALEIKPDYAEAHNNLGLALAGCGRVDEAIICFQKALEIKPDYAEARRNLDAAQASKSKKSETEAGKHAENEYENLYGLDVI